MDILSPIPRLLSCKTNFSSLNELTDSDNNIIPAPVTPHKKTKFNNTFFESKKRKRE